MEESSFCLARTRRQELRETISGIETFLSPNVHDLVISEGLYSKTADDITESRCITSDGLIDVERFNTIVNVHGQDQKFSRNWFKMRIAALSEVAREAHAWVRDLSRRDVDQLVRLCSWLRNDDATKVCGTQVEDVQDAVSGVVEGVLLLTASMDRALGNLYTWKSPGKPVPFLIRDLLLTDELRDILGPELVLLLQLLMGSPLSLNLRNLAWHGFINPAELSAQYASLLLVAAATIGDRLTSGIAERPCVKLPCPEPVFPDLVEHAYQKTIENLFTHSQFINKHSRALWNLALQRFREGKYGNCLSLIIPQLENFLRCVFAVVNGRPSSVLTAESNVLYITLDVILADTYQDEMLRENRLVDVIGRNALLALRDLFSFVEGPRLRDRLSHGECRFQELDKSLTNRVLALTAAILLNCEERKLNPEESILVQRLNSYEPQFHPAALLRKDLLSALRLTASISIHVSQITSELKVDYDSNACDDLIAGDDTLNGWLNEVSGNSIQLQERLLHLNLDFMEGYMLVAGYRQVVQDILLGVANLVKAIEDYYVESQNRTLRSRQRATFIRMLSLCPLYVLASKLCLVPCIVYLLRPPVDSCSLLKEKKFKVLCKFAGNLASLTRSDKNRWLELAECAKSVICCHNVRRS